MSKIQEIKSYTPPVLHTGKDWYIDFYAFNPVDGVMKRKKIKLNFIKSVKERRAYAKGCINRLSEKLATGWNPWIEQECGNAFLLFKDVFSPKCKGTGDTDKKRSNLIAPTFVIWKSSMKRKRSLSPTFTNLIRIFVLCCLTKCI